MHARNSVPTTPVSFNARRGVSPVAPGMHVQRSAGRLAIVVTAAAVAFGIQVIGQGGAATPAGDPPSRPTGLLAGQVVDAVTGRPIAGVSLSCGGGPNGTFSYTVGPSGQPNLGGPGRLQSPTGAPRQVLTDGAGRFVFRDLPKGNYVVRAPAAPGYLVGGYGQNRPYGPVQPITLGADDTKIGDLTIRLWKAAVIGGTVVDETGEPLVGLNVVALRRTTANGIVRLATASTANTDDRGVYRMPTLGPGEYLVAMTASLTTMPTSTADAFAQAMSSGGNASNNEVYRSLMSSGAAFPSGGGYRVGDLILAASGYGGMVTPPPPSDDGTVWVYPTTFYPAARSASQASIVKIGPGDDRSAIDLQLRLVPAVRVSGTVIGPDGPVVNTGVKLYSSDSDTITGFIQNPESAAAVTDGSGSFTFLGVPTGQYILKVFRVPRPLATNNMPSNVTTIEVAGPGGGMMMGMSGIGPGATPPPPPPIPAEPTLSAAIPLSVGETDVTGVNVVVRAGPRLSGRLQFDGTHEPPTPAQLQRANVSISSVESRPFQQNPQVRVDAEGRFTTGGFVPGKYQITGNVNVGGAAPAPGLPTPPGWTFKSATVNGRNLADDPLEIGGEDISGIVIAFTDRTTQVSGTVTDAKGQSDKTAEVIVLPADSQSWREGVQNPRRLRAAHASLTGLYEFSGLPPGEYFMTAVAGETPVDLLNPRFLEAVAAVAMRVTIADGDKKTQDLAVKPVSAIR